MRTHPGFAAYLVLGMLLCLTAAQPVSGPVAQPHASTPFTGHQAGVAILVVGVACEPSPPRPESTKPARQEPQVYPGPIQWSEFHDRNRLASAQLWDRGQLSVEVAGRHIECVNNVLDMMRQLQRAGIVDVWAVGRILPSTGLTEVVVRPPYFAGWTGMACLIGRLEPEASVVVVPRRVSGSCL